MSSVAFHRSRFVCVFRCTASSTQNNWAVRFVFLFCSSFSYPMSGLKPPFDRCHHNMLQQPSPPPSLFILKTSHLREQPSTGRRWLRAWTRRLFKSPSSHPTCLFWTVLKRVAHFVLLVPSSAAVHVPGGRRHFRRHHRAVPTARSDPSSEVPVWRAGVAVSDGVWGRSEL